MSFEPVARWVLRCDGITGRGQCDHRRLWCDPEDDDPNSPDNWWPVLYERPALKAQQRDALRWDGWLILRDGRVLCPRHVAGLEYLAHAALDGLPFDAFDDPAGEVA